MLDARDVKFYKTRLLPLRGYVSGYVKPVCWDDNVRGISQFVEACIIWVQRRFCFSKILENHERLRNLSSKCGICRWGKGSRKKPLRWGRCSSVLRNHEGMCVPGARIHARSYRRGGGRNRVGPGLRCLWLLAMAFVVSSGWMDSLWW